MNLFRIVFLFISLLCGGLLAVTQLAPPVFENETNRTLTNSAQAEARTLWQAEQVAALQRERLAASIASSAALQAALEPPPGSPPIEPARLQSVFRAVADEALRAQHTPFTLLTLVGADGTNQIPVSERGVINMEEWIAESLVSEAMESRTVVHHAFSINGRLFLSTAVPVRGSGGSVPGAVLLVLEYDASIAASRQSSVNAQIAYFAQLDIAADTIADDMLREPVRAFVRRVNEGRLGSPGSGGIPEDVRYRPGDAVGMGSGSDRMAVMVPISLQIGNSTRATAMDFAAVVIVDDAWPPSTLLEYIVEGQGLEAGNLTFWTFLALALALYFIALFIHDAFLGIALDRLGAAIEANAQSNSPHSIDAKQHPSWLRSLVSRVNILIEEYRSKASVARRAREEAEQIKEHVEAVTGTPAPGTTARRQSDTGSVPSVGPVRRAASTGSVPAIPLHPRPEMGFAEPASNPADEAQSPQPFGASGALPTVMGHANTEALPAIGAIATTEVSAAARTQTTPAEPASAVPGFGSGGINLGKAEDGVSASPARTSKLLDDGPVHSGAEALPDQAPMEFDGLFMTGQFSLTKLATVSAQDAAQTPDSPANSPALPAAPVAATAPPLSAPGDASLDTTAGAQASSTHLPPLVDANAAGSHEDMSLPEPPADDDRGESLSDDMLAALDAMSAKSARQDELPAPPEPNAQTRPPVIPVPPSHLSSSAPSRAADDAAASAQSGPPSSHTDALFSRAEEQMRKLSTTSDETFLLYGEFIAARRKCGESTAELTFEKFTQKLERSREQLRERYQTARIDFTVEIVENRATLKARPQRD